MPVVLRREDEARWLDPKSDVSDLVLLLKPYPADGLKAYEVSTALNDARNDSPDLIKPCASAPTELF